MSPHGALRYPRRADLPLDARTTPRTPPTPELSAYATRPKQGTTVGALPAQRAEHRRGGVADVADRLGDLVTRMLDGPARRAADGGADLVGQVARRVGEAVGHLARHGRCGGPRGRRLRAAGGGGRAAGRSAAGRRRGRGSAAGAGAGDRTGGAAAGRG